MKRIIVILILMFLTSLVWAAVDTKFAALVTDKDQREKVIAARAKLQTIYWDIERTDRELKEIAASGSFNTVDAELKKTLLAGWKIVQDANDAFVADPNVMKLLKWKPAK